MMWDKSLAAQAGGEKAPKEDDDAVKIPLLEEVYKKNH